MPLPPNEALINIGGLLPEIILLLVGCAVLLMIGPSRRLVPWVTLGAIVIAYMLALFAPHSNDGGGSGLIFTNASEFIRVVTYLLGIVLTLVNFAQPRDEERGEFFGMMLFALAGLSLLGAASDLVMLFVALELVSIPTYVLVVLSRHNAQALEAGTKYFYLGAMAAAITAYGFSFLYGVAGTASLPLAGAAIQAALSQSGSLTNVFAITGLMLALGGLFFKVAAFPLHFYIADVYQGAASSVAGLLGFVPKLAGFAAILKIVELTGWETDRGGLFWMLWIVAALSMTIGNVLALRQHNIKRMLGYSGIAHSGYMLVGVLASSVYSNGAGASTSIMSDGPGAVLFYTVAYGLANLCAFAVLGGLRVRGESCETLRDVAGLIRRQPLLAVLLAIAMFTLMGMPPTPGFWGKLSIFGSAWSAMQAGPVALKWWMGCLIILGVVNSAIGAAYYLRVIAAAVLYENDEPADAVPASMPQIGAMVAGLILVIFAFFPSALLAPGRNATIDWRTRAQFTLESRGGAAKPAPLVAVESNAETVRGTAQ